MSILHLAASALSFSLDAITTVWGSISVSAPGSGTNANQTLSFSGGARTIQVIYAGSGNLQYRINSGSYTTVATAGTFSVSSGDTLNFRYQAVIAPETTLVEIYDNTRGGYVSEFFVDVT